MTVDTAEKSVYNVHKSKEVCGVRRKGLAWLVIAALLLTAVLYCCAFGHRCHHACADDACPICRFAQDLQNHLAGLFVAVTSLLYICLRCALFGPAAGGSATLFTSLVCRNTRLND